MNATLKELVRRKSAGTWVRTIDGQMIRSPKKWILVRIAPGTVINAVMKLKTCTILMHTDGLISYSEDSPDSIVCSFCDQIVERKGELMRHKKNEHEENVKTCWKFTAGNCTFGDDKCWFMHNREIKSTEYKCQLCEKVFATLPDFMQHRKRFHKQIVQECKNENNGSCIYGKQNCWFMRKDNESTK